MTAERDQAFAAAFAEIRAVYALELPGEIDALVAAVGRAREAEGRREDAAGARTIAHRLCGTAGSYGFMEISEAAGRIEIALKALEQGGPSAAEAWPAIDGSLQQITSALEQIGS